MKLGLNIIFCFG